MKLYQLLFLIFLYTSFVNCAKYFETKRCLIECKHNNKTINFGLWPFSANGTYIDHHDNKIRDAWRARHSKIMKDGKTAYLDKSSPEYYSWNLLW